MGGMHIFDARGIEKTHPDEGKEILEINQLRLPGPRQGPHGDCGLLRIGAGIDDLKTGADSYVDFTLNCRKP